MSDPPQWHLKTWSPGDDTARVDLVGVVSLEKVCYWWSDLTFQSLTLFPVHSLCFLVVL